MEQIKETENREDKKDNFKEIDITKGIELTMKEVKILQQQVEKEVFRVFKVLEEKTNMRISDLKPCHNEKTGEFVSVAIDLIMLSDNDDVLEDTTEKQE